MCEWGFIALGNMTLKSTIKFKPPFKQMNEQMNNFTANNQVKAGQVGVIESVIDVMKTHPGHLGANKCSCDILMNISNIGK